MRLSCPLGSVGTGYKYGPATQRSEGAQQRKPPRPQYQVYQQQNNRLTGLYQISKNRNHRLLQLSLNLSRDVNFLKQYCKCLELQLERSGFYKEKQFDRLSRRETAASIFQNYSNSQSLLSQWRQEQNAQGELMRLRNRNSSLEHENKQLHEKVGSETFLRIHRACQVDTMDLERMKREYQMAQERIRKLTTEVGQLKCAKVTLEFEKRKRGLQASLLEGSQQIFKRIHEIMRDHRRKMNALAHEKRDVQKKYRILRQNIRLTQTGNQLKLIDLLTDKIDILENLVQKQQIEIESTIGVYESELGKIQEKRKQELQIFQNQRIGLQSQNLKLCIDVQKALNRQDSTNLLLLQERNTTQQMNNQVLRMKQNMQLFQFKERSFRTSRLKIDSGVSKFYGENFRSDQKIVESQFIQSVHSAGYQFSNNQNSNSSNFQYQYSAVHEGRFEDSPATKEAFSKPRMNSNVKITYNSCIPYQKYDYRLSQLSYPARNGDSAVEYKRRFVENKPETGYKK